MNIQAVTFDMGGTIETYWYDAEFRRAATEELVELLRQKDLDPGLSSVQLYENIETSLKRLRQITRQTNKEMSPECFWGEYVFADTSFAPEKIKAEAEELSYWLETRFYLRTLRPEVPAALEELAQMGLKLAVISNIQSRTQVDRSLEKYGIRQYFDAVVTSSGYGIRKPHPSIFHYTASLLCVPTSACAHVGDRISRDILGARRAGLGLAIQIVHDFEQDKETFPVSPDAVIIEMSELVGIIRQVNKERNSASPMMEDRRVKAILFDAGDVLYYRADKFQHIKVFLEDLGLNLDAVSIEDRRALEDQVYVGEISQDEHRKILLERYGVSGSDQIARGIQALTEDDNNISIFDGVPETLVTLKSRGYLLGIITDTANPVHVKLDWFERFGFGHVWDAIVSSRDVGVRKPDRSIYQAALRQLGIAPSQAVFVGHKPSELDGAHAVGINTIAFNHDPEAEADLYIERFADLLNVPLIAKREVNRTWI
jgi:putative hydrolase of the HAD superfamily